MICSAAPARPLQAAGSATPVAAAPAAFRSLRRVIVVMADITSLRDALVGSRNDKARGGACRVSSRNRRGRMAFEQAGLLPVPAHEDIFADRNRWQAGATAYGQQGFAGKSDQKSRFRARIDAFLDAAGQEAVIALAKQELLGADDQCGLFAHRCRATVGQRQDAVGSLDATVRGNGPVDQVGRADEVSDERIGGPLI